MPSLEAGVFGGYVSAIALDGYGAEQAKVTVTDQLNGGQHTITVGWKEARAYYVGQYAEIVVRLRDQREDAP